MVVGVIFRTMNGMTGGLGALLVANRERILQIVRSRGGKKVHVFGSIIQEEDTIASDVDLLVTFDEGASLLVRFASRGSCKLSLDAMSTY